MNLEECVELLEQTMIDGWDEKPLVEFDNVKFDQDTVPDGESFCHFQVILTLGGNYAKCGDGMAYKQYGLIKLYIYVPSDDGSKRCWQIADKFNSIFVNKTFNGIRTYAPDVSVPIKSSNWYGCDVGIEFEFNTK